MKNKGIARYRIFCPESEKQNLPSEITLEEVYPAFVIVSASEDVIAGLRKQYPIEKLAKPKPPPKVPDVANLSRTVGQPQRRGPYTVVVRFRAPVQKHWIEELEAIGCLPQDAIGSSTLVVRCPNKTSLAKLQKLPTITQVSTYVPPIRLTPNFFKGLGTKADDTAIAEAASNIASVRTIPGARDSLSAPGILVADFFTEQDKQRAKRSLRRKGMQTITEAAKKRLIINLITHEDPIQAIQAIVSQSGLRSIEEKKLKKLHNDVARRVIADRVATSNPDSLKLTGRGETVAVADTGLDTGDPATIHADFRGRVWDIQSFPIASSWSSLLENPNGDDGPADIYSGHGTHVCGSIAGNGARSIALDLNPIQGVAPEAEVVFQAIEQTMQWNQQGVFWWLQGGIQAPKEGLFGVPDDLEELFQAAYDQGARIHSNSWGGGEPGAYDELCNDLDLFVWEHKDFLVLAAAGNAGKDVDPTGQGIDLMSVDSPGTAKNCLTVGASENDRVNEFADTYGEWWPKVFPKEPFKSDPMADSTDDVVAFSSRGPCMTGRRKPDVIAPGTYVLSTRSSQIPSNNFAWGAFPPAKQDYMFMGGTSMATPLVAGCAVLVRQYLRHTIGLDTPSAALMKAAIIHSTQYQPYRYAHPSSSRWADNEQGWGRVNLQQVLNPPAPITVLFFDETAGLETGDACQYDIEVKDSSAILRITLAYSDFPGEDLINNLNLFAYDPNGQFFVGNDFEGNGSPDGDNNVEGIIIETPQVGTWSIRVVASDVPEGPQDFALIVSGGEVQLS